MMKPGSDTLHAEVRRVLEKQRAWFEQRDYSGFDPYDGLNSPIVSFLTFGLKYARIAAIQAFKRSPVNLRQLFLVPPGHNPKGLGLFLWGYTRLSRASGSNKYQLQINRLLDLLDESRSDCTGHGWGYNFDWQSRAFWVPKGTPTIVNSSFVGHALLDYWQFSNEQRALDMAVPIKDFILNDLNRTKDKDSFCFSYTPIDNLVVHNANLLGSSLLVRLHEITGEDELLDAGLSGLRWSMNRQNDDGSWPFADTNYQTWIDSFHTGFNLQSIRYCLSLNQGSEHLDGYKNGVDFYAKNFFMDDGAPKYFHNSLHPIDIHSPTQALVFFSEEEGYEKLSDSIMKWTLENLFDERQGYFYFRKGRRSPNRIPYMRWGQAWAFHALTSFIANRETQAAEASE